MCGIAGIIGQAARDERVVRAMAGAVAHRGPDDQGIWIDADAQVSLGHRRLAIVDLSPAGHQPMCSADGRFMLTFNGEIYNFDQIRTSLEADGLVPAGGWRGHSDTEVLLQAIAAWGIDKALAKSVGMFAFGLWDRRQRVLTLARDRFGEKPLYYGWAAKDFVFASEIKALRAHPNFDNAIDRRAVGLFAARTYIPAPLSIYRRVFKLPPACLLEVSLEGARRPLDEPPEENIAATGFRLRRYWSYREVVQDGLANPIEDEGDALEQLDHAIAASVRAQSFADVPVGAFLSGGIDSSAIVALYQKHASIPVRTFSIGFENSAFDEAQHAKDVAAHLGTIHSERYVTAAETRDVIPLLPAMYDEPFADSSQIPTHLVSRFAREQVTVALTGDGGDELFGGYNRHVLAPRLWQRIAGIPRPVRRAAGAPLGLIPPGWWDGSAGLLGMRLQPHFGAKVKKTLGVAASASSFEDIHRSLAEEWSGEASPARGADRPLGTFDIDVGMKAPEAVRMMYCDSVSYLPDDVLCKVDRASMAVALETRVPFLDHRVAELAARIPLRMKIGPAGGKLILRKLLARYVPRTLVDRPKSGFAVPVGEWIKGPLRPWAEELLDGRSLAAEGWFDPEIVRRRWRDHLSGKLDGAAALWAVLMFEAWLRAKGCAGPGATRSQTETE